jgi:hypothetical protein
MLDRTRRQFITLLGGGVADRRTRSAATRNLAHRVYGRCIAASFIGG